MTSSEEETTKTSSSETSSSETSSSEVEEDSLETSEDEEDSLEEDSSEVEEYTGLKLYQTEGILECGLDETGLGSLCGPVFAAAVIWPQEIDEEYLACKEYYLVRDSKKLTALQREKVYQFIKEVAVDYAVASVDNKKVDEIGIYQARFLAMRQAIEQLSIQPDKLLVDGDAFISNAKSGYPVDIPYETIVKGDGIYQSIAAASILAKCDRDNVMKKLHEEYPQYDWISNKGYPTKKHKEALKKHGITPYHRTSYKLGVCKIQLDPED